VVSIVAANAVELIKRTNSNVKKVRKQQFFPGFDIVEINPLDWAVAVHKQNSKIFTSLDKSEKS